MYSAKITESNGRFYAMVIRKDRDGQEQVDGCYKARHFATRKAAEKSTGAYISKLA